VIEQASNYDHWAWLYNQTLGPRYSDHKIGPIAKVVLPLVPNGGRILDLCCGTGHLSARLIDMGYSVTAFDGSADMLRFARKNAPGAEIVEGDARAFSMDAGFDCVLCTSASLNHMEKPEDLRGVFESVSLSLKPGGVFVFDVNHPAQMARYWHGQPAEGDILADHAWLITPRYDTASGKGSFTVDLYRKPANGRRNPLKAFLVWLTRPAAFQRWRLGLLTRFESFQPDWEHNSVVNVVWGHDLEAVGSLLREYGFEPQVRSTTGGPVDDSHSAYFLCRKTAAAGDIATYASLEVLP